MKHVFLDFEMNALADQYKKEQKICRMEIIEIGAVMLDEQFREVDSFKCYVKPEYNDVIIGRYTDLTGITTSMVTEAEHFAEAFSKFIDWCESYEEEYRIYAWSDNDLRQLRSELKLKEIPISQQMQFMMEHWEDYQKTFGILIGWKHPISLERALGATGMKFEGQQHDALCDARNTAELFIMAQDKELFAKKMKPIIDALKPSEPTTYALGDIFNFNQLEETTR